MLFSFYIFLLSFVVVSLSGFCLFADFLVEKVFAFMGLFISLL